MSDLFEIMAFMHEGNVSSPKKLAAKAVVALRADTNRQGIVLKLSRDGRTASVQFENYPRPTVHAVDGLVFISSSLQRGLFESDA
jgi:hypothetical protein